MDLDGDKGKTVLAMLLARAWRDPAWKRQFLSDPKAALAKEGIRIPAHITLKVVEDSPHVKYLGLTRDLSPRKDANRFVALFDLLTPIPEGTELRLVQSTDKVRYIVIPRPPASVNLQKASDEELMKLTADDGVEATFHDTTQSVEAETTEAAVTETTEAQDAETTTTVVAEAELVAT